MTHPLMLICMEGPNSKVGAENPYAGQGLAACVWRLGYQSMIREKIQAGPAMLRVLAAQKDN